MTQVAKCEATCNIHTVYRESNHCTYSIIEVIYTVRFEVYTGSLETSAVRVGVDTSGRRRKKTTKKRL